MPPGAVGTFPAHPIAHRGRHEGRQTRSPSTLSVLDGVVLEHKRSLIFEPIHDPPRLRDIWRHFPRRRASQQVTKIIATLRIVPKRFPRRLSRRRRWQRRCSRDRRRCFGVSRRRRRSVEPLRLFEASSQPRAVRREHHTLTGDTHVSNAVSCHHATKLGNTGCRSYTSGFEARSQLNGVSVVARPGVCIQPAVIRPCRRRHAHHSILQQRLCLHVHAQPFSSTQDRTVKVRHFPVHQQIVATDNRNDDAQTAWYVLKQLSEKRTAITGAHQSSTTGAHRLEHKACGCLQVL